MRSKYIPLKTKKSECVYTKILTLYTNNQE